MKRSDDRILTTHTGSLPRPEDVVQLVEGHDQQDLSRDDEFEQRVAAAVQGIVQKQIDTHVDVVEQ